MSLRAAVIVAHPDDETIWAGGFILNNKEWDWNIFTLCRASDTDRAPKFHQAVKILNATGKMDDIDDGPEQLPLDENMVREAVMRLVTDTRYDIIITHDPSGEYTRHRRHEELSRAVISLWHMEKILTRELWTFAYEDEGGKKYPAAITSADLYYRWPDAVRKKKNKIITKIYGFAGNSFEANAAADCEAFWQFRNPDHAMQRISSSGMKPK